MQLSRLRYLVLLAAVTAPLLLSASTPARPAPQDPKALTAAEPPAGAIWLDSLDLTRMVQRRGTPGPASRAQAAATTRRRCRLAASTYQHGIGTLSINELIVDLKGQATRFESMIGIDDAASEGAGVGHLRDLGRQQERVHERRDEGRRRRRSSCRSI